MSNLTYYKVVPFSQKEANAAFATGAPENISNALLGLAYFDPDWEYVRNLCIKFLSEEKSKKSHAIAATCLAHLARIHRNPEIRKVIPFLKGFLSDPEIGGTVEEAIQDIKLFTKLRNQYPKEKRVSSHSIKDPFRNGYCIKGI